MGVEQKARELLAAEMDANYSTTAERLRNPNRHLIDFPLSTQAAVRAIVAALRAALPLCVPWQPIETAPKDGSLFLCWVSAERWSCEDGGGSGRSADVSDFDFACWRIDSEHPDGGWFMNMAGQIGDMQGITHWMPLAPPLAAAPQGGQDER